MSSADTFIYKTAGQYLGFMRSGYVYSRDGEYLGWLEGVHVWDSQGNYRGQVLEVGGNTYILRYQFSVPALPKIPKITPLTPSIPAPPPNVAAIVPPLGHRDAF